MQYLTHILGGALVLAVAFAIYYRLKYGKTKAQLLAKTVVADLEGVAQKAMGTAPTPPK